MRNKLLVPVVALTLGIAVVAAGCSSADRSARAKLAEATTTAAPGNPTTTASTTGTAASSTRTIAEIAAAYPELSTLALQADPRGALANVLKLHVLSGKVMAADAIPRAGQCVDTLGGAVKLGRSGDNLTIGGQTVTATDIEASNGVVHVIDGVVTAPSTGC